jgi:hypothetical protein
MWNPMKGVLLKTSPSEFPIWSGEVKIEQKPNDVPSLEYKYVLTEANEHSTLRSWEPLAGNRLLDLKDVQEVEIQDIFG